MIRRHARTALRMDIYIRRPVLRIGGHTHGDRSQVAFFTRRRVRQAASIAALYSLSRDAKYPFQYGELPDAFLRLRLA